MHKIFSFYKNRAAIHRTLQNPPYARNIDIVSGKDFIQANKMFGSRIKLINATGRKPVHKKSVEPEDLRKIGIIAFNLNYHIYPRLV